MPIIAQTPDAVHSQSEFLIGDNVYISMIVRNNGNVSTGRKTNVKILIDGNEAANREIPVLEANGTCTISVNLGSSFTEGNHTWAVQIDADGNLEESIETNNNFSGNFSVIRSPYDEITTRLTCSTAISNVKILQGGSLGANDGARITNADIKGGFFPYNALIF
jgi:subtilase family serine protease